jgi:hypothetical protein
MGRPTFGHRHTYPLLGVSEAGIPPAVSQTWAECTHIHTKCKEQIQPTRPVKHDELPTETFHNRMVKILVSMYAAF